MLAAAIGLYLHFHHWRPRTFLIQGAVIAKDEDPNKELPISGADVIASDGVSQVTAVSDASGYFEITFPEAVWPGQTLQLVFRHADYQPYELKLTNSLRPASKELFVISMQPATPADESTAKGAMNAVSNIVVRYTVNSRSEENVGSEAKPFQVVNKGDVSCNGQAPCSPDGLWKASRGSVSLDAGPENEYRNVRASCIAGPCPFTRIDSSGFVNGGRTISASALDWSDTATFLVEAEVFRTAMTSRVRQLYPVLFGETLHFTLPPTEEGVTIEADVNGTPMVFPLGPELYLSWATCAARSSPEPEKTTVYRCEAKPGYRFK